MTKIEECHMQAKLITERVNAIAEILENVLDDVKVMPTAFMAMTEDELKTFANLYEYEMMETFDDNTITFDGSDEDKAEFIETAEEKGLEGMQDHFHVVAHLDRALKNADVMSNPQGVWGLLEVFKNSAAKMSNEDFQDAEAHYQHLATVKAAYDKQMEYRATKNPMMSR